MTTVSPAEARETLDALLDRVRAGEAVSIADAGREVARLVPPLETPVEPPPDPAWQAERDAWLEEVRQSREKITVLGEPMSETVIRLRREARY